MANSEATKNAVAKIKNTTNKSLKTAITTLL
ncbi:hypothetical protein KKC_08637 [Listeria fleischmannii subsp. coloradonensis]|nr:hypothetical protein KKC_08637 [Listeria fleischmannii subsp. coloradonensis]